MNIIKLVDKFNNSPKGRVLKSIFVLLFSIVIAITAVYAWFVNNVNVGSSGLGISADVERSFVTYTPYYISDIDTQTISAGTEIDARISKNLAINLIPYDITFTSTNVYTPVVLKILIVNIDTKYIPTGNATKQLGINIPRNTALDNGTSSTLDGIFSSVGHIGCYKSSLFSFTATNQTIYNTIITQYRADNNQYKFTTVTNNVISKINSLSINITYSASDVQTYNAINYLPVYLVFDYNANLAQLYANQHSSTIGGLGSLSQSYTISNDLTTILINFPSV